MGFTYSSGVPRFGAPLRAGSVVVVAAVRDKVGGMATALTHPRNTNIPLKPHVIFRRPERSLQSWGTKRAMPVHDRMSGYDSWGERSICD